MTHCSYQLSFFFLKNFSYRWILFDKFQLSIKFPLTNFCYRLFFFFFWKRKNCKLRLHGVGSSQLSMNFPWQISVFDEFSSQISVIDKFFLTNFSYRWIFLDICFYVIDQFTLTNFRYRLIFFLETCEYF